MGLGAKRKRSERQQAIIRREDSGDAPSLRDLYREFRAAQKLEEIAPATSARVRGRQQNVPPR